jgi:hypothetical protein
MQRAPGSFSSVNLPISALTVAAALDIHHHYAGGWALFNGH